MRLGERWQSIRLNGKVENDESIVSPSKDQNAL